MEGGGEGGAFGPAQAAHGGGEGAGAVPGGQQLTGALQPGLGGVPPLATSAGASGGYRRRPAARLDALSGLVLMICWADGT